ncbi:MAG TPA: hypothetical protein VFB99_01220 [Vicinamibacterales bacterium]|nr:hypothetical protein [Vicinamibacterales bacterium]
MTLPLVPAAYVELDVLEQLLAVSGQRERACVGPHHGMSVESTFRNERLELRRREREPRRRLAAQPTQDLDILGRRRHVTRKVDDVVSAPG